MKLKFCGLHHVNEFKLCNELGVDYAGFMHYPPSPRHISATHLPKISKKMDAFLNEEKEREKETGVRTNKKTQRALVTVNQNIESLISILEENTFEVLQLHGDEDAIYVRSLTHAINAKKINISIWKALRLKAEKAISVDLFSPFPTIEHFVAEMHHNKYGGVGKIMPYEILARTLTAARRMGKMIIASGGISSENLDNYSSAAKAFNNFYALDVSSSLEKTHGIKDFALMEDFCEKFKVLFKA